MATAGQRAARSASELGLNAGGITVTLMRPPIKAAMRAAMSTGVKVCCMALFSIIIVLNKQRMSSSASLRRPNLRGCAARTPSCVRDSCIFFLIILQHVDMNGVYLWPFDEASAVISSIAQHQFCVIMIHFFISWVLLQWSLMSRANRTKKPATLASSRLISSTLASQQARSPGLISYR